MPKLNKKTKKELKEIADKLPQLPSSKVLIRTGQEIMEDESLKGYYDRLIKENNFDLKSKYKLRTSGTKEVVNHFKRLQKCYEQGGMDMVAEYMAPYVKLANDLKESENKEEVQNG